MKRLAALFGFALALLTGAQQAHAPAYISLPEPLRLVDPVELGDVRPVILPLDWRRDDLLRVHFGDPAVERERDIALKANYDGHAYAVFQVYVSSVSFGGIPIGDNGSGNGLKRSPYLTADKALPITPLGGTTFFNGDPASPTTYTMTSIAAAVSYYNMSGIGGQSAIIAGSTAGAGFIVTMASKGVMTLTDLIVDPSLNSGGAGAGCIDFALNPLTLPIFTTHNVAFQNWTVDCFHMQSIGKATISINNTTLTADNARSCFNMTQLNAGSITLNVGTCTLTNHSDANFNFGGFLVSCTTTSSVVTLTDFSMLVTLAPNLSVNGFHYGFAATGCNNSSIIGSSPTIANWPLMAIFDPTPGTAPGIGITFQGSVGIPTNNNNTVHNVRCTIGAGGGGNCNKMGTDGVPGAIPRFTGLVVNGFHVENSAGGVGGGLHGIECGYTDGCVIDNFTTDSQGCALCIVDKESINSVSGGAGPGSINVFVGLTGAGFLPKGTTNSSYSNFTITLNSGSSTATGIRVESDNIAPFTNSTGVTVNGGAIVNLGTSGNMVNVNPSNTATFGGTAGNAYSNSGTLSGAPFVYQSTSYATCGLWLLAQEASAICNFP